MYTTYSVDEFAFETLKLCAALVVLDAQLIVGRVHALSNQIYTSTGTVEWWLSLELYQPVGQSVSRGQEGTRKASEEVHVPEVRR